MKPQVDDNFTLAQLSDAWNRFGCAICSHTPSRFAVAGSRIELHHILSRGQGGTDEPENLMGLCGELCDEKCHWKVTTNLVSISWSENAHSWIWQTADSSTLGFCRPLDRTMIETAGMSDALVLSRQPVVSPGTYGVMNEVPEEWLPADVPLHAGAGPAQDRFLMARELFTTIERSSMQLSLVLQYGMAHRDHLQLGFTSVKEWADAIGIPPPMMSKLRLVSRTFAGAWVTLSDQDQANLSIDALYIAARMVKMGVWEMEQALSESVAHPVGQLYRIYQDAKAPDEFCECPTCGARHTKKTEPPLG